MESIRQLMTDNHRLCDDFFVAVEQAVSKSDWGAARVGFSRFKEAMLQHFEAEEAILFPAFEAQTGMSMGPTQVMRGEHDQMRGLIATAEAALAEQDADEYSGNAETLLIMAQQHNMKEEGVLYLMCDQHLSSQLETLLPQLKGEIVTSDAAK